MDALQRAAHVLNQLAEIVGRPKLHEYPGQVVTQKRVSALQAPRKRSQAMEGFRDFAADHDWATVVERCRSLDRYLKYQRGKGASIEKAVDQLWWADNAREAERAEAALSYRVGHVWRFEMAGKLSQAGFEQFWSDWKASRQVRAAIDRALGQEDYL